MDQKTLLYSPDPRVGLDSGQSRDRGHLQVRRRSVDRSDHDRPARGRRRLTAGKSFGEIESVKAVSDLYAPVSGEVVEVNSAVSNDVQILAADPYEKGWLVKLTVDPPVDTSGLLDFESYEQKVAEDAH